MAAVHRSRMDAIALCVPVSAPDPPYYTTGPRVGMVRLVGFRWRPCHTTARILDVAGAAWPHRGAAIVALREAMIVRGRRYILRTESHCREVESDRALLAAWRL